MRHRLTTAGDRPPRAGVPSRTFAATATATLLASSACGEAGSGSGGPADDRRPGGASAPRDAGAPPVVTCVGTGGPSVLVAVRDTRGRPAAIGTTIVIRDGAFTDTVPGTRAHGPLYVGAGDRRPGRYEVRLTKPGYEPAVLRDVMAPGDTVCRYAEPTDVRTVALRLRPGALPVRSVVVLPPALGFGIPGATARLRAVVDADDGIPRAVGRSSSDTTVATVTRDGVIRSQCRRTPGSAVITATSVGDPRVRGSADVSVGPPGDTRGLSPPSTKAGADRVSHGSETAGASAVATKVGCSRDGGRWRLTRC